MKKIDSGYDSLLEANYELHAVKLSELKDLAKSWYGDIDFSKFDDRHVIPDRDEEDIVEMKKSGLISNYFFAYKEDGKYFLMDGFNRLFTDYGKLDIDCTVYIKVIVDKLEDNHLMKIMFHLNNWKLYKNSVMGGFKVEDFLDRGFRLFMYSKFGIVLYSTPDSATYNERQRNNNDIYALKYYFINEQDYTANFNFSLKYIPILFSHKNIINDIKEIIKGNDYKEEKDIFNHYEMMLNGFTMFIAWRRCSGDDSEYKLEYFIEKLKEDTKFFKKLQGMSWTDSTRKNVYKWYRELYKKELKA